MEFDIYRYDHFSLIEFGCNYSYQSSIPKTPSEALYGRMYMYLLVWFEFGVINLIGPKLVDEATEKV